MCLSVNVSLSLCSVNVSMSVPVSKRPFSYKHTTFGSAGLTPPVVSEEILAQLGPRSQEVGEEGDYT